jgi:acetoacetyl-CoA synthetase
MRETSEKHGVTLDDYDDLWKWSISEPAKFWEDTWHYTDIKAHTSYDQVSRIIIVT